jgi:hypothetical protein
MADFHMICIKNTNCQDPHYALSSIFLFLRPLIPFFSSFLLLLILQSFDWLTAFRPDWLRAILFLLYNCQLLPFWRLALTTVVLVSTKAYFPEIALSSMFTINSLCLIIYPIYKRSLFFLIFEATFLTSPLEKSPSPVTQSVHFIFNILL